jgi:hypothetical protein
MPQARYVRRLVKPRGSHSCSKGRDIIQTGHTRAGKGRALPPIFGYLNPHEPVLQGQLPPGSTRFTKRVPMLYSDDYPFSPNERGKKFLEDAAKWLGTAEMEQLRGVNAERVLKI